MDAERFYQELDRKYGCGPEQAERFLLESRETLERAGDAAGLVTVHNELGSFYRGTSRYQESLAAFQKAGEEIVWRMGADG